MWVYLRHFNRTSGLVNRDGVIFVLGLVASLNAKITSGQMPAALLVLHLLWLGTIFFNLQGCARHDSITFGYSDTVEQTVIEKPTTPAALAFLAVQKNQQEDLARLMTKHQLSIDMQDEGSGRTLLMEAIVWDRLEIAEWLVKQKPSLTLLDRKGKSAVDYASANPRFQRLFASQDEQQRELADFEQAIVAGDVPKVRPFLQKGIELNQVLPGGETPLTLAIVAKSEAIVRLLLQRQGLDVNLRNSQGQSPLGLSRSLNLPRIERFLIQKGATP